MLLYLSAGTEPFDLINDYQTIIAIVKETPASRQIQPAV